MKVEFEKLREANLIQGAVYKSNGAKNKKGEVLSKLMNCRNSGGFRKKGDYAKKKELKYVVLSSTGRHTEWKDSYNEETNEFLYYGDQYKPGKDIIDTFNRGNEILELVFKNLENGDRRNIPPFFAFINQEKRDVKFIGLAVPGSRTKTIKECLIPEKKNTQEGIIRNYKSIFTILDIPTIDRRWLDDLENNFGYESEYAPHEWIEWVDNGYKEIEPKEIIDKDTSIRANETKILIDIVNGLERISFKLEQKEIEVGISSYTSSKKEKDRIIQKSTSQYIDEYIKKQYIGIIGEYIIFKHEKEVLENSPIKELREKSNTVEWSSKIYGDGLGYDIKSYGNKDGHVVEKYIEVKTTLINDRNFDVTSPEVEKSILLNNSGIYVIARVYNLDIQNRKASYYYDYGKIEDNYSLEPKSYKAIRKCENK